MDSGDIMKRILWISILIVFTIASCNSEPITNYQQEKIVVGNQSVQLTFSSDQSSYEGTTALPTNLEIENQSDHPIYLPWGIDPGYNLIVVGLDSTSRTMFAKQPQTLDTNINEYSVIKPGDKITTDFPLPAMMAPGRYNVCAEILIFGNSEEVETYNVEFDSLKHKICIEILYK